VIEMPEHAWRKDATGCEQVWFYKMYTSAPHLQANVDWFREGNTLSFSMQMPSGFTLNSKVSLETDGVGITHDLRNHPKPANDNHRKTGQRRN
jgi:hypothetical protein